MENDEMHKVTVRAVREGGYYSLGQHFPHDQDTEVELDDDQYKELVRDRSHLVIVGGPDGNPRKISIPREVFKGVPGHTHRSGLVEATMQSDDHIEAIKKSAAANAPEIMGGHTTVQQAHAHLTKKAIEGVKDAMPHHSDDSEEDGRKKKGR